MAEKTVSDDRSLPQTETGRDLATREPDRYLLPPVDIFEDDEGLTLLADMPGVRKDALDIRVEDKTLTIEGRCADKEKPAALHREFELVPYFRQFQLSDEVDRNRIEAQLKHGVLTLRLPKAEHAKPRRIEVKVAS